MLPRVVLTLAVAASAAPPAVGQIRRPAPGFFPGAASVTVVDPAAEDGKALAAAGLKADDPAGLLDYFRQRTLSDAELARVRGVIKRLGADGFDDRQAAAREAEGFGPGAVGPLRVAHDDPDPEVSYRAAECLKRLEKQTPPGGVALAAVRAVGAARPAGAGAVLLGFLPLADDPRVADEIRAVLPAVAAPGGAPDPGLLAALGDLVPARRAAAAVALLTAGPRLPDVAARVRAAVTTEADSDVRFEMAFALLTLARDKGAVATLLDVLPDLPRGRLWQAEDLLLQLAGPAAPKARFGRTRESVARARDAWKGWWDGAAGATDLGAFQYAPRTTGRTLLVLMDVPNGGGGAVAELGPDLKERWRLTGLAQTMDAQVLPDGRVAVAETNASRVTVRDTQGRVLAIHPVMFRVRPAVGVGFVSPGQPQQIQVLPNGNLLVGCRSGVVEWAKDTHDVVFQYAHPSGNVVAARRLADGRTALLTQDQGNFCLFLDAQGKPIPDPPLRVGMPNWQAQIDAPAPGRLLLTEINRVAEYDLATGKEVWSKSVGQPRSVQRLPNGNTLVVDGPGNVHRVVEIAPDGDEVWSHNLPGTLAIIRAYRR